MRARTTFHRCAVIALVFLGMAAIPWSETADSAVEAPFDHFTTGFRLEGSHRLAECESCHVNGVFEGTPTECSGCHTQASQIRATFQPPTHLPVTKRCESCHRADAWEPVARFDHLEVLGTCSSCHNNRIVSGQPAQHIPTTLECDSCHNSLWWH